MRSVIKKTQPKKNISKKMKIIITILLALCGLGYGFYVSKPGQYCVQKFNDGVSFLNQKSGLRLAAVLIEREDDARTTTDEINQKADLRKNMSIFDIDIKEVQQNIMTLPWIKNVVVRRQMPNVISIYIQEKTPIAIWQNKGKYWPIDEKGDIIKDTSKKLDDVVLVVGKEANKHAPALKFLLSHYPTIDTRVKSVIRVGDRRWNLMLDDAENGLIIQLPESHLDTALERVVRMDDKEHILSKEIQLIDVRLPDRFIVQTGQLKKAKGK